MIRALAADTWARHPACRTLLVPVATGNRASWRALERAGFVFVTTALLAPDNPIDPPEHRVYRLQRTPTVGVTAPAGVLSALGCSVVAGAGSQSKRR